MEQTEEPTHHVEPPVRASKSPTVEIQNVWASSDDTENIIHGMAECPGCIAEQELQHTCGIHDDISSNHSNHNIPSNLNSASAGNKNPVNQTTHPPNVTQCQHRRSKWHEPACHIDEYSTQFINGQDYDYFYEDPAAYGAVSAPEGAVGVVPQTYIYDTVADGNSHIGHNPSGPLQGSVPPTVVVRHIYHTGAPPQFVAVPQRLPVSYISAYPDPYAVSHGARIPRGMSFPQEDLGTTNYVLSDPLTTASCDTNDSTPATSTQCVSQPVTVQSVITDVPRTVVTSTTPPSVVNQTTTTASSSSVTHTAEENCSADGLIQPNAVECSVASSTTNGAIVTPETPGAEQEVPSCDENEQQAHQETQTYLDNFSGDDKPIRDSGDAEEASHLVKSASFTSSSSRTSGTPGSPPLHRQDKRRSISSGQDTELETVKRGTPLYGQPSWWGEIDADDYKYPHTSTLTEKDKVNNNRNTVTQPVALNLGSNNNNGNTMSSNDKRQTDPQCNVNYMEIPCQSSDNKKESSNNDGSHTPPERDTGPLAVEDTPLNKSNTAFTVDFGDEDEEVKAATKNRPIGEFLPSGLRRSFRQREEKIKEMQEKKKGESAARDQLSGPELSPARQRKTYNWHSSGGSHVVRKNSLSPQRSGYHSDGHNSNMSSDNEDLSIRSESFASRAKRIRQSGRSVSVTEKRVSSLSSSRPGMKSTRSVTDKRKSGTSDSRRTPISDNRRTPVESRRTPTSVESRRTPTERRGKMEHRKTPTGEKKKKSSTTQPVPSDPAYLINKMFASQGSLQDAGLGEIEPERNNIAVTHEHKHKSSVMKPRVSEGEPLMSSQKSLQVPKKDEDACSETGTYTIQGEKEQKEIENARKSIDKVFGVVDHQEYVIEIQRPVIDLGMESPVEPDYSPVEEEAKMQLSSEDMDDLEDELGEQAEVDYYNETHHDDEGVTQTSSGWIQQVIGQENSVTSSTTTEYAAHSSPLHQPIRRGVRPGTGRKLPSPPVARSLSDGSCYETDISGGRHRATVTFDSGKGGTFLVSFDAPQREMSRKSENQVSDTEKVVGKSGEENKTQTDFKTKTEELVMEPSELHTKQTQKKKIVIIQNDSQALPVSKEELLIPIKDTDSDTDSSSCAIVGSRYQSRTTRTQQSKEKPKFARSKSTGAAAAKVLTESPRAKSTERRPAAAPRAVSSERRGTSKSQDTSQRPPSASKTKKSSGTRSRTSSTNRDPSTSDGPSESESASIISSSTDYSETSPRIVRKSSGGKGAVMVTRTNRTAILRRQKVEMESESNKSDSSTLTPRSSRPNSTSLDTPTSPRVSSRVSSRSRSSSRSRPLSAQESSRGLKTDPGLGQRIVEKSRENQRMMASGKEAAGKYSRSVSCKTTLSSPRSKSETKEIRPRSGRSAGGASGLMTSGNRSQPSSRSNSPRTQEYNAWKRRKSYDPRQAVAEAKATKKISRSKSAVNDHDKSVSSVSSEDSANLDDSCGESSRTDDIIKLSTEIYKNLAAMSRENDSEEVDILMSYNTIILRSIFEISNRVRHKTDALMDKLKSHDLQNVRGSDKIELDGDSPGLQELAGILSNLRTTERHLQVIDRALFPRPQNRSSIHDSKHVKELERIRSELADFKPVERPARTWGKKMHKQASHESDRSEPFTGDDYCDPYQIQDA